MDQELILVDGADALQAITKAEVDIQIATAHRFPRVVRNSIAEALDLATITPEQAERMTYSLPRDGKTISGPSVRFAEIVAHTWGNMRAAARIIAVTDKEIVAQGVCHDLEKNVATSVEVRRRITTKDGRRFKDDMITVAGNAAASIAFRNAVFKVVPPSLFQGVLDAARSKAKEQPFEKRLAKVRTWLKQINVDDKDALALISKKAWELCDEEDIEAFQGVREAINEGTTTREEAFGRRQFAAKSEEKKAQPEPDMDSVSSHDETQKNLEPTAETQTQTGKPKSVLCPEGGRKSGKMVPRESCFVMCDQASGCPAMEK